ncbi:sporulation integral membrane protein YlbJ [Brevibacillus ginsengisoli]|uniref:sporulation integral membrane protein YlbJ n=1 Tax=Brevibacillus ginsengisoli TaxID=363854 RepID=UPI003CF3223B
MKHRSLYLTLFIAMISIGFVVILVTNPNTSFLAALAGLKIWWEVVFPACLPFIVVSEVLMGVGIVHFAGVLLEPLMRPLFNVPGTGGFVMTMGFASGYPVAAKLTTRLREQGSITQSEGERLVSFTTTGDPLFVIGAVAVGFFHSEQLGYILAFTHYVSAILLGLVYRFYALPAPITKHVDNNKYPVLVRAIQAMHRARLKDNRPFGKLMGDAVSSALQTLFMIGGFIIFFSVVIELLATVRVTEFMSSFLAVFLGPFGFPSTISKALVSGLFEVTLGAQTASLAAPHLSFMWQAAIASAIVSWGGLSVHAQVASILSQTDIRFIPYLLARGIHAIIAVFLTIVLWKPLEELTSTEAASVPVFFADEHIHTMHTWWNHFSHSAFVAALILLILIVISRLLAKSNQSTY